MTDGHAWSGNWNVRLYERARERGYTSLTAFAAAHPTTPLFALAEELGAHDVAGVQVLSGLRAEAEASHQVSRFVRDVLVRLLSQNLPLGWPETLDDANRFKVAKTLGQWFAYTPESQQEHVDHAGDVLLANPPPPGWRPLNSEDALLRPLLPDDPA
ncbi:NUDIX hydrolase [Myxococcus stipitatus]|uniref:NUDIX hydrolase n=1 Tax=Myxococcus stipitatus TaxID=83455 RepID=UPI0031453184